MAQFSVLTTVYDPAPEHLAACLASVRAQTLHDWEHVLVDDASTQPHVRSMLAEASAGDVRVKVVYRSQRGGIGAASSDALVAATGEFVALLDHDDDLEPDALEAMASALASGGDVAYSDHDMRRDDGALMLPTFKPEFSPEHLRNQNYILHFLVARRSLVEQVGGFREGFDGAQDHDLVLRVTERAAGVVRVPRVLYHWRQAVGSVAAQPDNKPWAYDAGVRAVADQCARLGIDATVEAGPVAGTYRVRRRPASHPLISVVIPTRGSSGTVWGIERTFVVDAIQAMVETSTYPRLEFVVVADVDTPPGVLAALERVAGDAVKVVPFEGPFNFSAKINAGALAADGDLLLLLNDDTEPIEPDSLEVMVAHLEADDVAMVGAKLLYADGTIQDAGHVYNHHLLGALSGWDGAGPGPGRLRPLAVERECSGVTAAVALVSRQAFEEVGGLTTALPVNFNDVDFSLKLRHAGYRIIWTPYASWFHFESQTRDRDATQAEYDFIDARWHHEINNDPYYSPNLMIDRADWLERPWLSGAPPLADDAPPKAPGRWRRR